MRFLKEPVMSDSTLSDRKQRLKELGKQPCGNPGCPNLIGTFKTPKTEAAKFCCDVCRVYAHRKLHTPKPEPVSVRPRLHRETIDLEEVKRNLRKEIEAELNARQAAQPKESEGDLASLKARLAKAEATVSAFSQMATDRSAYRSKYRAEIRAEYRQEAEEKERRQAADMSTASGLDRLRAEIKKEFYEEIKNELQRQYNAKARELNRKHFADSERLHSMRLKAEHNAGVMTEAEIKCLLKALHPDRWASETISQSFKESLEAAARLIIEGRDRLTARSYWDRF